VATFVSRALVQPAVVDHYDSKQSSQGEATVAATRQGREATAEESTSTSDGMLVKPATGHSFGFECLFCHSTDKGIKIELDPCHCDHVCFYCFLRKNEATSGCPSCGEEVTAVNGTALIPQEHGSRSSSPALELDDEVQIVLDDAICGKPFCNTSVQLPASAREHSFNTEHSRVVHTPQFLLPLPLQSVPTAQSMLMLLNSALWEPASRSPPSHAETVESTCSTSPSVTNTGAHTMQMASGLNMSPWFLSLLPGQEQRNKVTGL